MEKSLITLVLMARTTFISLGAYGIFLSGWAMRSIEGLLTACELGFWDLMSVERDGIYEGMYRSRKYHGQPMSDRMGPIM